MSAEDVAQYMRTTVRTGPDGASRNLEDTIFQVLNWVGETLNTVKPLADDEAKVLGAVSGAKGEVLAAISAIPASGQMSPEQIADLATKLRAGLGEELSQVLGHKLIAPAQ